MNKLYVFLGFCLFVVSSWTVAEEAELLDSYLESLPSTTSSQNLRAETLVVDESAEVIIEESNQTQGSVQPQTIEYRRISTADGSEVYKEVPDKVATPATEIVNETDAEVSLDSSNKAVSPIGVANNQAPAQDTDNFELIELEPDDGDYKAIEAHENQTTRVVTTSNAVSSGATFCQQNPYARECLLSKYLSLCKKDPQSEACKSELQKFDRFCGIFPRAYKCKKAKIAASCKQDPSADECKTFTQKYCQSFPKAIFCKYN